MVDAAKRAMAKEVEAAAQQAASAERTSLLIGAVAAVLMFVTTVLSIFLIGRPMQRLSRAMQELADGNFEVSCPASVARTKSARWRRRSAISRSRRRQERAGRPRSKPPAGPGRGRATQGRDDRSSRTISRRGRRDRQDGVVGLGRTGSVGRNADVDRRAAAATDDDGGGGVRGGHRQRAVGGVRHRGAGLVGHRDQPSGAGIGADGQ